MIKNQMKRIMIIILFVLIIFLIIFFIRTLKEKKLDEKINHLKENSILFVYDSTENNFPSFTNSIQEINYLNDVYHLNIQFFDLKGKQEIYQKIKKKNKDFIYNGNPIIQIIKKENSIFFQNIIEKKGLLTFFKENGYINNKEDLYEILSVEEFNQIEKDDKKYLIVVENRDDKSINLRKKVFQLSKQYHFKFYTYEPLIIENIGLRYYLDTNNLPYIIIYKNNKIETEIYEKSIKKIKQKLLDAEFISK